ncbi:MAG TPA: hypothetical protein VL522_01805, partial [Bordetella sp.]|nr:hypothetical protein [Bordetella sp.]
MKKQYGRDSLESYRPRPVSPLIRDKIIQGSFFRDGALWQNPALVFPCFSFFVAQEMPETSATTSAAAPAVDQARIIAQLATELGARPNQIAS